jgi:glucose/arabinose dehydrogenase
MRRSEGVSAAAVERTVPTERDGLISVAAENPREPGRVRLLHDIAQAADGSLLVGDDTNAVIYRIPYGN